MSIINLNKLLTAWLANQLVAGSTQKTNPMETQQYTLQIIKTLNNLKETISFQIKLLFRARSQRGLSLLIRVLSFARGLLYIICSNVGAYNIKYVEAYNHSQVSVLSLEDHVIRTKVSIPPRVIQNQNSIIDHRNLSYNCLQRCTIIVLC